MRRARVLAASIGLLSLAALLGIIAACGEDLEVELTRGLGALGPVPTTPDNLITDAKVELGMLLMFDNRMSGNESTACTGCHVPDNGWGDGGGGGRFGKPAGTPGCGLGGGGCFFGRP